MKPDITISDLAKYTPQNISKQQWMSKTIKEIIQAKEPRLFELSDALGIEPTIAFIASWLEQANDMINVKRGLNPTSIEIISMEILKDFGDFKISEFISTILTITKAADALFYQSFSSEHVFNAFRKHREFRKRELLNISKISQPKPNNIYETMSLVGKNIDKMPNMQKFLNRYKSNT